MSRILCIGEEWKGSNASGLFYALSRAGHETMIVNPLRYISVSAKGFRTKAVNKLVRPLQVKDYNDQILKLINLFKPDLVLVYKGIFVKPDTLQVVRKHEIPVINFFPDVSFLAHGSFIPKSISLYDHIFTTKTFASKDLKRTFNYPEEKVSFVPHGFDPLIHQKRNGSSGVAKSLSAESSFIGNYSQHKIEYLEYLKAQLPNLDLKIWGGTWHQYKGSILMKAIQGIPLLGDSYALGINHSKVNIALLSEKVKGASSGDKITSRTFHIPGSGGFMLHERTEEVLQYFTEDEEIVCFDTEDEFVDKVQYYLSNPTARETIAERGYLRAQKEHSLDARAKTILKTLKEEGILSLK